MVGPFQLPKFPRMGSLWDGSDKRYIIVYMENRKMGDQNLIKVSVICLVYNEEEYLRRALDSMVKQKTNFIFEIICHDDASTDKSPEILREYEFNYPDIVKCIYQRDNKYQKGEQIILKYIYPVARGEYMAYCDGDDYWTDSLKLQKQVDFLDTHLDYGMCLHSFQVLKERTGKTYECHFNYGDCDLSTSQAIRWDSRKTPQLGTSVFRREMAYNRPELFQKIGGGNSKTERFISDHPLYIYFSLVSKIRYLDQTMSCWRRRVSGTWGRGTGVSKALNHQIAHREFFNLLDKYTNGRFHADCLFEIYQSQLKTNILMLDYREAVRNPTFPSISIKLRLVVLVGCVFPKFAKRILNK